MKIRVYCFHHPPHKGVGGRRWAEFSSRLQQRGHDVLVTCAPMISPLSSFSEKGTPLRFLWRSIWHRFPFKENRWFLQPLWTIQKWIWALAKGGYADQTDGLIHSIRACVRQDIVEGADLIVVSCAPFHWANHIGEELHRYPENERPKFIVDLRDPWSSNEVAYFTDCSESDLKLEKERERQCWQMADQVLVVEPSLVFDSMAVASRWTAIPNGAVMNPLPREIRGSFSEGVHAVFLGTLYQDGLSNFLGLVGELKRACDELGLKFQCSVAGRWLSDHKDALAELEYCTHLGFLDKAELQELWSSADVGLSVLSETMTYALNTKILECISMRKPVLVVSEEGQVSRWIRENSLGFWWNPNGDANQRLVLKEWVAHGMPFGPSSAHMKYDLSHLVDTLEEVFRET